ncbi:MAG: hypothetical protein PHT69_17030 [Bacteroidales bacterium]|nr:hypothetical protein [Bacteroidales bacterium]
MSSSFSSNNSTSDLVLPWVSIAITFIIGLIAILQSYHYYKLSSKTNQNTNDLLLKISDIVVRLETVTNLFNDKVFVLLDKTVTKATDIASTIGGSTIDSLKKDLEKTIVDGSEKVEGQIKSLVDNVDKNQITVSEIKTSINVIANAVQDVFNKVINNIDDFEDGSDEYHYIKSKILDRCQTDIRVTVKDIFGITSNKISISDKMKIIEKLKTEKIIDYQGDIIYESTIIFIIRELEQ